MNTNVISIILKLRDYGIANMLLLGRALPWVKQAPGHK